LNSDYRPSQIQKATILLVLAGVLSILLGYQSSQWSVIYLDHIQAIIGILVLAFGFLTLCISIAVWLQKPWTTRVIAGIGIGIVTTLVVFGFYLISVIIFAPLYWFAIKWVRTSQPTEIPDWASDWNKD
jgi:hypothetical protein